jgi:hypothetical protein
LKYKARKKPIAVDATANKKANTAFAISFLLKTGSLAIG